MLNDKQKAFVYNYLKHKNGARAAREAGYSEKTARTIADQLLTKLDVRLEIEKGLERLADRANITAERNVRRIAEIAYHSKKAKHSDVLKACELIGKTFGQFKDVSETTNTHQVIVANQEQVDASTNKFLEKIK